MVVHSTGTVDEDGLVDDRRNWSVAWLGDGEGDGK